MRLLAAARSAAALSAAEWGELARAQAALVRAQVRLWTRPAGRLVATHSAVTGPAMPPTAAERATAVRVARAVRRAAERGLFRPRCLARSLALAELLARRGIAGVQVRVGVRREGHALHAHAWVEHGGRVLADDPSAVAAFAPLLDVRPGA